MSELDLSSKSKGFGWWLDRSGTIMAFVFMIVIFGILSPYFLQPDNVVNIMIQVSPLLVTALGIVFVNMAGESDLSLGGVLGLGATLYCGFLKSGMHPAASLAAVIGICVLFARKQGQTPVLSDLEEKDILRLSMTCSKMRNEQERIQSGFFQSKEMKCTRAKKQQANCVNPFPDLRLKHLQATTKSSKTLSDTLTIFTSSITLSGK